MNLRDLMSTDLALFFKRLVSYPPPVPSIKEHEEHLRVRARKIMRHHGEGNVLLASGRVNLGDVDFSENDATE